MLPCFFFNQFEINTPGEGKKMKESCNIMNFSIKKEIGGVGLVQKSKEIRYNVTVKFGTASWHLICKFRTLSVRILPNLTVTYCTIFPCFLHH